MVVEVAMSSLLLGVIVAVLWARLAPDVYGQVFENGVGRGAFASRLRFGQDVTFGALGAGAGALLALVFCTRYRRRPVSALIALVGAGVAGSVLAWRLGSALGPESAGSSAANVPVGDQIVLPLEISSYGVLLAWSIMAALVALVTAVLRDDRASWSSR